MDTNRHNDTDILESALDELRHEGESLGPSPQALARTRESLATAGRTQPGLHLVERIRHMKNWKYFKKTLVTAAAAAVVIAAVAVWMHMPRGSVPSFTGITFANVQQQIRDVNTMSCIMNMTMKDQQGNPQSMTMKMFMKEQGFMRQEFVNSSIPGVDGNYVVTNIQTGKIVTIVPAQKMAIVMDFGEFPPELMKEQNENPWMNVKKMIEGDGTSLGERTIDGKKVQGFDVTHEGQRMQIWVNDKTASPIEVCMEMPAMNLKATMSDFRFNEPMKDSLFSQDIPNGFKVQNMDMSLKDLSEKDLLDGLRMIAEYNDNVFPEGVFDISDYMKIVQKLTEKKARELKNVKEIPPEEFVATIQSFTKKMTRMLMFAMAQQEAGQFEYFGGGVKLGDAGKVIVLYRLAGSQTLRMIFGDLSIKDVPATTSAEK